jgi:hypothetical protein
MTWRAGYATGWCCSVLALCLGCGGQGAQGGRQTPAAPEAPGVLVGPIEHFTTSAAAAPTTEVSASATEMKILEINERREDAINWCWAATAQIITGYLDSSGGIEQCKHAEAAFKDRPNLDDCCKTPTPDGCKDGSFPLLEAFHYSGKRRVNKWLSWSAAKQELAQRPFAVIESKTSSAHMVPIRGWATVLGFRLVVLFDPTTGIHGWRLYDDYRNGDEFEPGFLYYQLAKTPVSMQAKVEDEEPPLSEVTGATVVGGGGATSPSAGEALAAGLEVVKLIGVKEPRLLGFSSAADAAKASVNPQEGLTLVISTDGTIDATQPERKYYTLFLDNKPHGMIVVKQVEGKWYPVRFQADESGERIQEARRMLAQLQLKEKSLVFVPVLGRYMIKATTGMILPVGRLGTLKKNRIYTPRQVREAFRTRGIPIPH